MFEFAKMLLFISFGYALIAFYESPLPGIGVSFSNLITDQTGHFQSVLERKLSASPVGTEDRRNGRYADACKAFGAPRYRMLYRAWLRDGPAIIDATTSPVLRDAIERGTGRIESCVLSRPYLHLSPLVGTS